MLASSKTLSKDESLLADGANGSFEELDRQAWYQASHWDTALLPVNTSEGHSEVKSATEERWTVEN